MAGSSEFKVETKDVDGMVAALKKEGKSRGFDFKGDKKSGSAIKDGATIRYAVKDQTVTLMVKVEWDFLEVERLVKGWVRPYQ
jgi:hypothetical protein